MSRRYNAIRLFTIGHFGIDFGIDSFLRVEIQDVVQSCKANGLVRVLAKLSSAASVSLTAYLPGR